MPSVLVPAHAVAKQVRRMRNLSSRDWRLMAEAIVLAPLVELGLRVVPLNRLLATTHRERRCREPGLAMDLERTSRIVEAVFRHYPLRASCLKKSLVLLCLARLHGQEAQLRIGVRRDGDDLLAHAWVECAGRARFSSDGVEGYQPLPSIAAAALARSGSDRS